MDPRPKNKNKQPAFRHYSRAKVSIEATEKLCTSVTFWDMGISLLHSTNSKTRMNTHSYE